MIMTILIWNSVLIITIIIKVLFPQPHTHTPPPPSTPGHPTPSPQKQERASVYFIGISLPILLWRNERFFTSFEKMTTFMTSVYFPMHWDPPWNGVRSKHSPLVRIVAQYWLFWQNMFEKLSPLQMYPFLLTNKVCTDFLCHTTSYVASFLYDVFCFEMNKSTWETLNDHIPFV